MTYATATTIRKIIDKYSIDDKDSAEICDYISKLEVENCSLLSASGMMHEVSGSIQTQPNPSANSNSIKLQVDIDIKYDLDEKNVFSFDATNKHLDETFIARTLLKIETQLRKKTNV